MKRLIIIAGLLVIFTNGWTENSIVTVQGFATVKVIPDQADLNFSISDKSLNLETIKNRVGDITTEFIEFCKDLGVEKKNLQTSNLNITPEYSYNQKSGKRVFNGYIIDRQLKVNLDDLSLLGKLIENAISIGINNVSPPIYKASNLSEIRIQLHTLAMENAMSKAKALIRPINGSLGKVISIDASQNQISRPPVPYMEMRSYSADNASQNEQNYEIGELTFEQSISASFEIQY